MTPHRDLQILLVEDELLNRELVKAILAQTANANIRSADLVQATTLAEARAAMAAGPIDLVLLDIQLPDGSGLQLATEICARPPGQPRPAIIAVTAGALIEQHDAAIAAGCDSVITKPYTAAELEAALTNHTTDRALTSGTQARSRLTTASGRSPTTAEAAASPATPGTATISTTTPTISPP